MNIWDRDIETVENAVAVIERLRALSPPEPTEALLAACNKALNFITNTESELGITLDSGDALRAALRAMPLQDHGWQPIERSDGSPAFVGWEGSGLHAYPGHRENGIWGTLTSGFGFEAFMRPPTHFRPLVMSPAAPAMVAEPLLRRPE